MLFFGFTYTFFNVNFFNRNTKMSDNQELIEVQSMQEANNKLKEIIVAPTEIERKEKEQELVNFLNQRRGLFGRLFPSKGTAIAQEIAIQELQQITSDRIEAAKLLQESRIAEAREYANVRLAGLGVQLRAQLAVFANAQLATMQKNIDASNESVFLSLDKKEKELDLKYGASDSTAKTLNRKILIKQMETQLEVSEKLINGFIKSLDSRIPK